MKKAYSLVFLSIFVLTIVKGQSTFTYTGKPMYKIDVKRGGIFLGSIKVELFPNIAPLHVRNFDSLVSVQFYDTTAFHRVIPGFMIQGGDPNSRHGNVNTWGFGQPGQPTVNAEFTTAKHLRGSLSAARGPNINSATSQFFICVANNTSLNGQYSVYGRVIDGMNYADTIVLAPRNGNDLPNVKHEMFITAIGSNDTIPNTPALNSPPTATTEIDIQTALLLKWNGVKDGIIYTLQVAEDTNFVNIIKTIQTGNLSAYLNTTLKMNQKYFWRVRVNNGGHFSNWSTVWTFKTITDAVGIKSYENNSNKVSVFPNPSHDKFTFSHIEKGSKLEIYDIAGKLIYEAFPKEEVVVIDFEGKEKGIYSYKIITSKKEVVNGKLLLK